MPGLKAPARRHTETARGVKTVTGGTTAELIRKRSRSELEVVRGLLQKAELLVAGKAVDGGAGAALSNARRVKNGRFLPAESRPEAMEAGRAGAKRRKASPLVEIIEPRMSRDEREQLAGSLSSLSAELPAHIVEFMQRQCSSCDAGLDGGEMEINLYSTGDASLFQLKKLLDEFAAERKQRLDAEPEHKNEAVDASGAMSKDEEDEFVDICGDASPVVLEKKTPEIGDSPSSSSSSSSSSGSSCSGDSSDSDSDSDEDESVSTSPAPAFLPTGAAAAQEEKLERTTPPADRMSDLIAKAQEEKRRCLRELERKRAREELQEMERTAMQSDSIHPMDMVMLGFAEVEHTVSSDDETSPVRQLGLFLK